MVAKPTSRAPRGARLYQVWRSHSRIAFWWRGKWRGIGLPSWELFSLAGPFPVLIKSGGVRPMPAKPIARDSSAANSNAQPGAWEKSMPQLTEWLTKASYDDGSPMGAVQLQLRREGTVIRATLKIADQGGLKCSAIECSPSDALLALDILLSGTAVPWEVDSFPLGGKPAAKKR